MDRVLHESTEGMVGTGGEPGWKIYWSASKQIPKALCGSQGTAGHRILSCGAPATVTETPGASCGSSTMATGQRCQEEQGTTGPWVQEG